MSIKRSNSVLTKVNPNTIEINEPLIKKQKSLSPYTEAQEKLFLNEIDEQKAASIKELGEWVAVKSVSSNISTSMRDECHRMLEIGRDVFIKDLGAVMKIHENPCGEQVCPDGSKIKWPGIILGHYPAVPDPKKKTILIYGHLDVQPAAKSDGWDTDPWVLEEVDNKLYGRGSTDDKGPVLGWLIALRAMKKHNIELPVNLKFCFEGMEESGSVGLPEIIKLNPDNFFYPGVDGTIISDNYWLGTEKPCLTYGLRGIGYFQLSVECSKADLHSGCYGGTIHEGMTDLISILHSLVDNKGKILIDGIYDQVTQVTEEENDMYKDIDFDRHEFVKGFNGNLINDDKILTLQNRWRNPTCSIHGIEGAFSDVGEKTVIPRKVIGKFSIRTVPDMTGDYVVECVRNHVEKMKKELNSPNKIWLSQARAGIPWYGNPRGYLFEAAIRATQKVYGQSPDMTREGGSIPVTIDFQEATKNPVILIPMGCGDDGAHSQNEKINIRNFIEGTKLLGISLLELDGKKE